MFGKFFYNEGMRKCTIAFGAIFNKIQIQRTDSSDNVVQSITVPLAYAPKEKFLARLEQQPNLQEDGKVSIVLPRMSFEIKSIAYDSSRKLTRMQKFRTVKNNISGKVLNFNYTPVPYNIGYDLNIYTKTAEGGLQIVEQILPFFQPDYTVTINTIPEMGIKRDVPIVLNSVSYEDSYDGSYTNRRAVNYTLNFTAKTYLYGPITTQRVIKETQADSYTDTGTGTRRESRIIVVPNPTTADADDDFGFTTTISNFTDAKEYNPTTDTDE